MIAIVRKPKPMNPIAIITMDDIRNCSDNLFFSNAVDFRMVIDK
jgi:hypothetical protein